MSRMYKGFMEHLDEPQWIVVHREINVSKSSSSFTNIDVIFHCVKNFVWTNQTIICMYA